MRILFNAMSALGVRTGVGHHTAQLLAYLRRQAGAIHIDVYPSGPLRWAGALGARIASKLGRAGDAAQSSSESPAPSLPRRLTRRVGSWCRAAFDRHGRSVFSGQTHDLYHEPNFIPQPSDIPTLSSIHDLSGLLHPEWHPPERVAWFAREFPRALVQSTHLLAVSEFTRQEMIRTCGVKPERITCVHNGVRADCRPLPAAPVTRRLQRLGLPRQYLLCVGTIEPRKNVLRLLHAYCALAPKLRERCPLLLAGPWGWHAAAVADYYHAEARARGVRHLGYVADRDLPVLYNGARALVYPSLYEGFGLPVAEMLACGGAVITSTAAALQEVAGARAHLVAPEDIDGWRTAMARIIEDEDWRSALRCGTVERAGLFSWERAADETLNLYKRLIRNNARTPLAA